MPTIAIAPNTAKTYVDKEGLLTANTSIFLQDSGVFESPEALSCPFPQISKGFVACGYLLHSPSDLYPQTT